MRPAQIYRILTREVETVHHGHHTPVMLWGPPGVGKSQMVADVAARHDMALIDIRLSQMEPSDLRGIPFRVDNRVEWAVPAMLPEVSRHGERGVLFLDEITSAPPAVAAAAYQLILDRRLGEYQVPEGWVIFAAGNRQGDRGVTYSMPAPLANRFTHFEVEAHLDDWASWAYGAGMDERIIGFLRFRPDLLFDFDPNHNPVAFPSPRSWEFASRAVRKFESEPALLKAALQACVGDAAGVECAAFMHQFDHLPDVEAILRGQERQVPEAIDLQYAVAAALVGRVAGLPAAERQPALGHLLDYASGFPAKEMGVMLVADLQRVVGDELFALPQFEAWAQIVGDVMLLGD